MKTKSKHNFPTGTVIVLILGLLAAIMMYVHFNKVMNCVDHNIRMCEMRDTMYMNQIKRASLAIGTPADSTIASMYARLNLMEIRQQELVNDMRQETNNALVKIDSGLTFWVFIIGLLGVFIPVVLQFRLHFQNREEFDSLKDDLRNRIEEEIGILANQNKNATENLEKIKGMSDELNCLMNSSSILMDAEYRLTTEIGDNSIFSKLWNQILRNFEEILKNKFEGSDINKNDTQENRERLMTCLMLISAVLNCMKRNSKRKHFPNVVVADDMIRQYIIKVSRRQYANWAVLKRDFDELMVTLRKVN